MQGLAGFLVSISVAALIWYMYNQASTRYANETGLRAKAAVRPLILFPRTFPDHWA